MPHLLSLPLNPSPLQSQFSNLLHSKPLSVTFSDNHSAFLSPTSPLASAYARLIDHAQQSNHPVYIETDATNIITRLCVPEAARVWEIDNTDEEEVYISLHTSSSIYSLARSHPEFQMMFDALQTAMQNDTVILLTATMHRFEIVDVRALPAYMEEKELLQTLTPEPVYPVDSKPITPERAEQLFKMLEAVTCNPPYGGSNRIKTCIPFKYPGGGCNIRAHLMSFLLLREKEIPEKIWSEGFMLTAHTMNDPNCTVSWSWHVAVTLLVKHPNSDEPEKMVFDPSLFDKPVPVAVWSFAQGKKLRSIKFSPWTWYERFGKEADETKANSEMEKYRGFLDALWAKHGPSPYENCRIK